MTDQQRYLKTQEILKNFPNAEERMKQSALFNQVIQMMVRDLTPYQVIDQLITVTEDIQRAFEQYAIRDTRPISMK
jgi:chorismate mutase